MPTTITISKTLARDILEGTKLFKPILLANRDNFWGSERDPLKTICIEVKSNDPQELFDSIKDELEKEIL